MHHYRSFIIMTVLSTLVMYAVMFAGIETFDHFYNSQGMVFMALLMGSSMAVIMLLLMLDMYKDRRMNIIIVAVSTIVFAGSLYLLRSQQTVGDSAFIRMMIPHHSMAILSSENAKVSDDRLRKIADQIIESQKREISEMKTLLEQLER